MTVSTSQSTTATDPFYATLEDLLIASQPSASTPAEVLRDLGCPGNSIAILDDGDVTSHMISIDPKHNADTVFQACSISKPCAGLGIARLIEQGLFGLDDLACDLLPTDIIEIMTADPRTAASMRSVTVRMLMTHTAGLSTHGFFGYRVEEKHPLWTESEIIASLPGVNTEPVRIIAPLGLDFKYSGGGITVLQAIVAHMTGKSFPEAQQELVFDPLGMTRSFYQLPWIEREEGGNVAEPYYTGRTKCDTRWHVLTEYAAGGLWTTPTDLLRMVQAMHQSLADGSFISKDLARKILTKVKTGPGLIWFANGNSFGHGGNNFPGYNCLMYGYGDLPWNDEKAQRQRDKKGLESNLEKVSPPKRCGISVMTNSWLGTEVLHKVINAITYLKGWPDGAMFYNEFEVGAPLAVRGDIETGKNIEWKEWIGEWEDEDEEITLKIAEDGDGKPAAGVDIGTTHTVMVGLRTAATPPVRYLGDKKSIDLVFDGMEVMLRLGWEREKKKGDEAKMVVELFRHAILKKTILYRKQ